MTGLRSSGGNEATAMHSDTEQLVQLLKRIFRAGHCVSNRLLRFVNFVVVSAWVCFVTEEMDRGAACVFSNMLEAVPSVFP